MPKLSLSGLQTVVGVTAGLISIAGAVYSGVHLVASPSSTGEVVTIVQEARSTKPVSEARIDVLTADEALVASIQPNQDGRARQRLKEGAYSLRVSHPRYTAETRKILVTSGQTAEVHIRLTPRRSSPVSQATETVSEGVGAVRQFFRGLGL